MSNEKYDVILIGAGPSTIFMAYELIKLKKYKKILMVEQGKRVEDRNCPLEKMKKCVKCKPYCSITSGFSGAGAFSDGKLSKYDPNDDEIHVGGHIQDYIGVPATKKLIDYTDSIYLKFGADKHLEGIDFKEEVEEYKRKAKKEGIELISIPIRHLGTEKAHDLYKKIEDYLEKNGVEMRFDTTVTDLIIDHKKNAKEDENIDYSDVKQLKKVRANAKVKGIKMENVYTHEKAEAYADKVVIGVGRKGANWLVNICEKHNIKTKPGIVDVGVRYELEDSVMADINKYMYEGKFVAKPLPFADKVRTFCQNPSGFVSAEVYDNDLTLVNGHSYKERKSKNTNLAILVSHNFNYPFKKPIEYGRNVAKNLNALGGDNVVVQRLGDIYRGKRTWENDLKRNRIVPTLKSAVPGDITFAIGYRTMTDILQFIQSMDKIIEGFGDPANLLYAPEIKFYSNQVLIDDRFETSISGLYSIGDGGGLTRGLMMASCSGVYLANKI